MPILPINGSILYEEGEICQHNKIAKTIDTIYNQSSPIRLKDVCRMRTLGDRPNHSGSEYDCCNFLWSVTLQRGNNPYEAKKETNSSRKFKTLPQTVYERLRNSFQRYRTHLALPKISGNMPLEWIMQPHELVNISSGESISTECSRRKIRKKSRSSAVPTFCKQKDLRVKANTSLIDKVIAPNNGVSVAEQDPNEVKCKKNQANERRRIAAQRLDDGTEKLHQSGGRRTIVVKKQLADNFSKAEYTQKQRMKANTRQSGKQEANSGKTTRALQLTWAPLPPISPAVAPTLPQQMRSQICLLEKFNLNECLLAASNASTLNGFSAISSTKIEGGFTHGRCMGGDECAPGALRKHVLRTKPNKCAYKNQVDIDAIGEVKICDVNELRLLNTTLKRKKPNTENLVTEQNAHSKKEYVYRHYRVLRRRAKCKRLRNATKHISAEETAEVLSKSSASIRSDTTALLSDASKEMQPDKQNKSDNCEELKKFLKEYKIAKATLNAPKEVQHPATLPTAAPISSTLSENPNALEVLSEHSDYIISFHTPITMRTLIHRRKRAKHLAEPQQIKHANANLWMRARGSVSAIKQQRGR